MSRTAWAGAGAVVTGVAYAGSLIGGWGGETAKTVVSQYGLLVLAAFAAASCALTAWSAEGRQRRAWICLTGGLIGWAAGAVLWIVYAQVLHRAPFPSFADVGYLLFPILAGFAMVLLPVGYSSGSRLRYLLDGFIVAGALFEISWVLVLRTVYDAGGANAFALGLSLAYPIADIVILTVAAIVLTRARTGRRSTLAMLTVGVVLMALSDSAFVYLTARGAYVSGHVVDMGWAAAFLTFGMAALISRRAPETDVVLSQVPSRVSLWLLYVPVALAAMVCIPAYFPTPGLGPIFVSSSALMAAVMARQYTVVRQNQRLLGMVADQA
ncbi:MAG: bifunctional diguanylate cyclase/phosphodiesterase, partial [Mycobacterium sp.]